MKNDLPENLEEAIRFSLTIGPLSGVLKRTYNVMRDFTHQEFAVAFSEMEKWRDGSSTVKTPEEILQSLFERLVSRDNPER